MSEEMKPAPAGPLGPPPAETAPHPPAPTGPAEPAAADAAGRSGSVDPEALRARIIEAFKTCYDPEIPVDIYELGLIYGLDVSADGSVQIRMTLTSPMCPAAGSLPPEVEEKAKSIPGVTDVKLELVWDPPWDMTKLSEAARLQLNMFY